MALFKALTGYDGTKKSTKKSTSQGQAGRGRRIKISTSTMNKHKKDPIKNIGAKEDNGYRCNKQSWISRSI